MNPRPDRFANPEPRRVKVMEPEAPVMVPEPIQGPYTDAEWLRNLGVKP